MKIIVPRPAPVEPIRWPVDKEFPRADALRLDALHDTISGNKWFKLRYFLEEAREKNIPTVATWGGAWSNHLHATAALCREYNLQMIALVRGEEPRHWSPTLLDLKKWNARIHFLSRNEYRLRQLPREYRDTPLIEIPEGGAGETGIRGAMEIAHSADFSTYSHIACAAGTGTTAEGLYRSMLPDQTLLEIPVLKGWQTVQATRLNAPERVVLADFHFGGYAKHTPALLQFMNDLYGASRIPTDIVYTGKLFYAIHEMLHRDFFPNEARVLVIHSGGLQGNRSLDKGTLNF